MADRMAGHRLAQLMADNDLDFNLEEPDVYDFLSRAALNFESGKAPG